MKALKHRQTLGGGVGPGMAETFEKVPNQNHAPAPCMVCDTAAAAAAAAAVLEFSRTGGSCYVFETVP